MATIADSPYTHEQVKVWLQGLLTIAWADGHFDSEEKALIADMTESELAPSLDFDHFEPISPSDLAAVLEKGSDAAQNFLRMAVMVALADGVYSTEEDETLQAFCVELDLETTILESLRSTLYNLKQPDGLAPSAAPSGAASGLTPPSPSSDSGIDPLKPAREWLDQLAVEDPRLARFVCKLIPPQCPFERDVKLFGRKIVHIPPMCKLNPLYDQLVGLRFRALSYLADDCGEDVSNYI